MSANGGAASYFFSSDPTERKAPQNRKAHAIVIWKCDQCGANLLTSERRGAAVKRNNMGMLSVSCSKCGLLNDLTDSISWDGQISR